MAEKNDQQPEVAVAEDVQQAEAQSADTGRPKLSTLSKERVKDYKPVLSGKAKRTAVSVNRGR